MNEGESIYPFDEEKWILWAVRRQITIPVNLFFLFFKISVCGGGEGGIWDSFCYFHTKGYVMNLLGMAKLLVSLLYTDFFTAINLI